MAKVSYKINRLINNDLQLGLKNTNAVLTGTNTRIESKSIFRYNPGFTEDLFTDNNDVVNKLYVDKTIAANVLEIKKYLADPTYIIGSKDARIEVSQSGTNGVKPQVTIGLANAYSKDQMANSAAGIDKAEADTMYFTPDESTKVVSKILVDKFGAIKKVEFKKISAQDLNNDNTYDNYKQWSLKYGNSTANILSTAEKETPNKPLEIAVGGGVTAELDTANLKLTLGLGTNNSLAVTDSLLGLSEPLTEVINAENGLYFTKYDKTGRLSGAPVKVTFENLVANNYIKKHAKTQDGIVNAISTSNKETASTTMHFYNENGKWSEIPYNKVDIKTVSDATEHALLATATGAANDTAIKSDNITITGNGKLKATSFSGDGASLTNITAANITGDKTLPNGVLSEDVQKLIGSKLGTLSTVAGQMITAVGDGTYTTIANPIESAQTDQKTLVHDFVLSKSKGSNNAVSPKWVSIDSIIGDIISGSDGMRFIGVIKSIEDIKTKGSIKKGDVYKIGVNDLILGTQNLDTGDTIYAIKDGPSTGLTTDNFDTYFASVQNNLDNPAVVGGKSEDGVLIIKQPGVKNNTINETEISVKRVENGASLTIDANISKNAATATKLDTPRTLWGQSFDGSQNVSGDISNTGNIIPVDSTKTIGDESHKYASITATKFVGYLDGTAQAADKVNNSLTFTGYKSSTVSFDGSEAKTIDLSASGLGYITSVADGTAVNAGNVVKSIATSTSGSSVSITPTLKWAIDKVESTDFKASVSNDTATINFLDSFPQTATFYKASQVPTRTDEVKFNGILFAKNFKVISSENLNNESISVAQNKKGQLASGEITNREFLVADATSGEYGFIKSGIKLTTTLDGSGVAGSDVLIPSAKAVSDKIKKVQTALTEGATKCFTLDVTSQAPSVTPTAFKIPSGSVIDHIDVYVSGVFDKNAELTITIGGTTVVNPTESDLSSAGDVFTYKLSKPIVSESQISAAVSNKPTTGVAKVYLYYSQPLTEALASK